MGTVEMATTPAKKLASSGVIIARWGVEKALSQLDRTSQTPPAEMTRLIGNEAMIGSLGRLKPTTKEHDNVKRGLEAMAGRGMLVDGSVVGLNIMMPPTTNRGALTATREVIASELETGYAVDIVEEDEPLTLPLARRSIPELQRSLVRTLIGNMQDLRQAASFVPSTGQRPASLSGGINSVNVIPPSYMAAHILEMPFRRGDVAVIDRVAPDPVDTVWDTIYRSDGGQRDMIAGG